MLHAQKTIPTIRAYCVNFIYGIFRQFIFRAAVVYSIPRSSMYDDYKTCQFRYFSPPLTLISFYTLWHCYAFSYIARLVPDFCTVVCYIYINVAEILLRLAFKGMDLWVGIGIVQRYPRSAKPLERWGFLFQLFGYFEKRIGYVLRVGWYVLVSIAIFQSAMIMLMATIMLPWWLVKCCYVTAKKPTHVDM